MIANNTVNLNGRLLSSKDTNYIDIARFIAIWLVVFGHFPFQADDVFLRDLVYTFHMPLFFMISGILYKNSDFSMSNLKKIFISLIIPYFIYNFICAVIYYPFTFDNPRDTIMYIILVDGKLPSGPSWFFLSLFWIRLMALFIKSKMDFIFVSFMCVVLILALENVSHPYINLWRIKAAFCMFPFFTAGFLLKDNLWIEKNHIKNGITIIICILLLLSFTIKFGRPNPGQGFDQNVAYSYVVGFAGSIAFIYISQYLLPILKSNYIKTISRGTMMIVGLHGLITSLFWRFCPDLPSYCSLLISLIITLLFYFPIKHTFNKIPILFGKQKNPV